MVSVVSSSWDPDFGRFFPNLTKSGVPGQKNLGFWDPENRVFRGPKTGFSGVRKPGFPGSWPDFGFSGFWPDFGVLAVLAVLADFGYPGA